MSIMEFHIHLTEEELKKCKHFADFSSKSQREYRSGGTQFRTVGQIFYDTLRGKIGEVVAKKFLEQTPLEVVGIDLDFGVYPRGVWDQHDIEIKGKKFSIKSSKHFARWLLLESKDILREDIYDYYILILIDNDFKGGILKGFATKQEILETNSKTLLLKKGDTIPNTSTVLDADNHARHSRDLHNSEEEWFKLISNL